MAPEDSNPFTSTEKYYAEHRPDYPKSAFDYLGDYFDLDESSRVLDLDCGTGQIAVPLAARVGEVVGMDPNEAMLRRARKRAESAGRENVEWVVGSDADLGEVGEELGPVRLATMGRSFHWMDQRRTLKRLSRLTESGGVALLTDPEWLTKGTADWQDEVYAVVAEYLDDLPARTGPVVYDDPWDELLAEVGFDDVEVERFEFEREWTVDSVVGYVFSLSFCSPATFGQDAAAFEADLHARLTELAEAEGAGEPEVSAETAKSPEAAFVQRDAVDVTAGRT